MTHQTTANSRITVGMSGSSCLEKLHDITDGPVLRATRPDGDGHGHRLERRPGMIITSALATVDRLAGRGGSGPERRSGRLTFRGSPTVWASPPGPPAAPGDWRHCAMALELRTLKVWRRTRGRGRVDDPSRRQTDPAPVDEFALHWHHRAGRTRAASTCTAWSTPRSSGTIGNISRVWGDRRQDGSPLPGTVQMTWREARAGTPLSNTTWRLSMIIS